MRSVPEWIGKTPDTKVPTRVKLRILDREKSVCHECDQPIHSTDKPEFDHRPALINGGENQESKIFPVHVKCHKQRTAKDVAEKAKVADVRAKNTGITRAKGRMQSRGFAPADKVRKPKPSLAPIRLFEPKEGTRL